ncbi:MAG TPA: CGNR zinc finger domain-containing protein [Candidatus Limnocylindria bacterium]|nr:CGNR zinc finger domain-containing protein [Candidatus Limnocylindria bacterium]
MNPSILWPQPGDREPAPNVPLHLLQDFVNTNDVEGGEDELASPDLLRDWLAERGLMSRSDDVSELAWRRAIDIREGLRALGKVNNGEPLDADQLAAMNHAAADVPVVVGVDPADWRLRPAEPGADGFLGAILATLAHAMADGSWSRVKSCRNDTCRWLFYDHSRNRSGTWCTMAICGSRMKSRAYRSRQKAAPTA